MPWRKYSASLELLRALGACVGRLLGGEVGLIVVGVVGVLSELGGHEGGRVGKDAGLALVDVSDCVVLALRPSRVVVDEGRIDWSKLGIRLHLHSLIPQNHSTLPLSSLDIDVFRIMNDLPA